MLNVVVCVKQVVDPEAPVSAYEVDSEAKRVKVRGAQPVQNPDDESALEAALRVKDSHGGRITVVSMGRTLAKPVLRKSLAAGADEMVFLEDDAFDGADGYMTAGVLAASIVKIGEYDLIFTGLQAADTNAGVVGLGIAEILGIPCITAARRAEVHERRLRVERVIPDGYQVVDVELPAVVTVSHELGELRAVGIRELIAAQKRAIMTYSGKDLGFEVYPGVRTRLLSLFRLERKVACEIVWGETPEEAGAELALRLRRSNVL
jgi:electron transfer flavoprotein beta subunit